MTLTLGPNIALPDDAVTQSFAVLAVKGAGKSNVAVVMAEEMQKAGHPWVAIDPKGDWWGIRSDGKGGPGGMPVPILGGLHGDLPLEPEAGRLVAELIVTNNLSCVLDVSEFPSKAAQVRFLTDLAEKLFKLHGRDPQPRHLFLEEADDFIPQRVMRDLARCVGAWTKLVKQGRSRGLGITLISQRSAVVNKDALTQTETLLALRSTSPQDRKAIAAWVDYHSAGQEILDTLPTLADGEAWVVSPHWLGRVDRVRFRRRATFDSGSTPVVGKGRKVATLADVDLGALQTEMTAAVARADDADPKKLQHRIRQLERDLAAATAATPEPRVELVEVPALAPELVVRLEKAITVGDDLARSIAGAVAPIDAALQALHDRLGNTYREAKRPAPVPVSRPAARAPKPEAPRAAAIGDVKLGRRERAILTVLAQFPDGRTQQQVAILTGYSVKASTVGAGLSTLRKLGFVTGSSSALQPTIEGIDALGVVEPLPSGPALLDYWKTNHLGQREKLILDALVYAYPSPLSQAELAEITGYSAEASTIGAGMSKLRSLGLADGWRLSDDFKDAIS